jgi:hypothetical protein
LIIFHYGDTIYKPHFRSESLKILENNFFAFFGNNFLS